MGKVCELIGQVLDGTPVENRVIDGERFFTIKVSFRKTEIPVLFSEYIDVSGFEKDAKVRVTGCIMSDIRSGELPVFYFYANKIELADLDEELTNEVKFSCTVTKVKDFQTNTRCVDILPLVAADSSPLKTTSILYLCARNADARKLKGKPKGYTITGKGYLTPFRDVYEIYITEVENVTEDEN